MNLEIDGLLHAQAPRSLELREGAQVMLTRNANPRRGLVNGARGVVQRFAGTANRLPVVRFASVRARLASSLASALKARQGPVKPVVLYPASEGWTGEQAAVHTQART